MTSDVNQIPDWLYDAIDEDAGDEPLNKRTEPRHLGTTLISASLIDIPSASKFPVKIMNISEGGIGLVSRTKLEEGMRLRLAPDWVPDDAPPPTPVSAVVIHCTQTIQGYKIGAKLI